MRSSKLGEHMENTIQDNLPHQSSKTNFSPESHSFNISVAEKYGIEEAIFINHFAFWIKTNTKNKNNYIDGKVWMYQTYEEILHHFPYFKNKQKVIRTIQSLVDQKVLVKKSFNKCKFDRTNWFTFISPEIFVFNYKIIDLEGCTENGLSINHEKRFLDVPKTVSRCTENGLSDVPKMDHLYQIIKHIIKHLFLLLMTRVKMKAAFLLLMLH